MDTVGAARWDFIAIGFSGDALANQNTVNWSSGFTNFASSLATLSGSNAGEKCLGERLAGKTALITAAGQASAARPRWPWRAKAPR
jgi:hypothetical protein